MVNVNDLLNLDHRYVIGGLILLGVVMKFIWELLDFLIEKTGIEFKWKREQKEDHKMLHEMKTRITELDGEILKESANSYKHDKQIESNLESVSEKLSQLCTVVEAMNERDDAIAQAMIELMYCDLSEKCHKYLADGYIPEDEVGILNNMITKYKAIGGNHGLEKKVKYCMDNLPLHPSIYADRLNKAN